ncbi:MAG: hypothetical protein ACK4QL_04540 [Pseudanabaenaceae cyanobacterium]
MLQPLKKQTLDQLIPAVPTSDQYQYYWGSGQEVFRRVLASIGFIIIFTLGYNRVHDTNPDSFAAFLLFVCAVLGGLYWMLEPIVRASIRNSQLRKFNYCAFWYTKVYDVYLSQEVSSKRERISNRGTIDVDYDAETFINVELEDETGLVMTLKFPMRKAYKRIQPDLTVCLLVFANDRSFQRISKLTSDAYLPKLNLWLGEYPYLRKDAFIDLARYLINRLRQQFSIEN